MVRKPLTQRAYEHYHTENRTTLPFNIRTAIITAVAIFMLLSVGMCLFAAKQIFIY